MVIEGLWDIGGRQQLRHSSRGGPQTDDERGWRYSGSQDNPTHNNVMRFPCCRSKQILGRKQFMLVDFGNTCFDSVYHEMYGLATKCEPW
jgi:hypothetical protein